jgi:formylglycine-generating enzyme required for sulfatase activity
MKMWPDTLTKKLLLTIPIFAAALFSQARRVTPIAVERKQALIIGNFAYARAPLKNPANDAAAMGTTLRKVGFDVRTLQNLDLQHMEQAIDEFTAGLGSGSLALFYFSGHGVQVNSTNYLLPVDFAAASETDVKYKAYSAERIQEKMEASGARLRVLILDACRNNPFRYKRDVSGGLAAMSVNAEGTLVAFATGDNNTADDNQAQANGLYTRYLMPALLTPGLELREVFQKAKEDVYRASQRSQNPSVYENVVGAYYLTSPPRAGVPVPGLAPRPAPEKTDAATEAWRQIRESKTPEDFESFIRLFPSSPLASVAGMRAAELRKTSLVASATPGAPSNGTSTSGAPNTSAPKISSARSAGLGAKVNPKNGLTYVWIPPGQFMMGCSPGNTGCNADAKPVHKVTITKGFWMGQTEVTQEAYIRVAGTNPSHFIGQQRPVENVAWDQARTYCEETGSRLPTESEWEYAARAGSTAETYANVDSIAWYRDNSGDETHAVKGKLPNAWGLYDILGNVWEWVAGFWGGYPADHVVDPQGATGGRARIMRGGSYKYGPWGSQASSRYMVGPAPNGGAIGFRCVSE